MAGTKDEVIKEGFMIKRSQNKKVYTLVNYKRRWFVLTRRQLIYYDVENESVSIKILITIATKNVAKIKENTCVARVF